MKIKKIKEDEWGREVYQNVSSGQIYKKVDEVLHTTTKNGEPDCPLRKDLEIEVV